MHDLSRIICRTRGDTGRKFEREFDEIRRRDKLRIDSRSEKRDDRDEILLPTNPLIECRREVRADELRPPACYYSSFFRKNLSDMTYTTYIYISRVYLKLTNRDCDLRP